MAIDFTPKMASFTSRLLNFWKLKVSLESRWTEFWEGREEISYVDWRANEELSSWAEKKIFR
jgi:hypothetical protein